MNEFSPDIRDIHKRISDTEDHLTVEIGKIATQTTQIYEALMGDLNSPEKGLIPRVGALEAWRRASATRVKSAASWVWGVLGSVIGGTFVGLVLYFLVNKGA